MSLKIEECFLCCKQLENSNNIPNSAAKLYARSLIQLLTFQSSSLCTENSVANNVVVVKQEPTEDHDTPSRSPVIADSFQDKLQFLPYCLKCCGKIRQFTAVFKKLCLLESQILSFKKEFGCLLADGTSKGPEGERLRNDIVQGFNLRRFQLDSLPPNSSRSVEHDENCISDTVDKEIVFPTVHSKSDLDEFEHIRRNLPRVKLIPIDKQPENAEKLHCMLNELIERPNNDSGCDYTSLNSPQSYCSDGFDTVVDNYISSAEEEYSPSPRTTKKTTKRRKTKSAAASRKDAHLSTKDYEEPQPHECPQGGCESTFRYQTELKVHIKTEHEGLTKSITCEVCSKQFFTTASLRQHKRIHATVDPIYNCRKCPETFTLKKDLILHHKENHKQIPKHNATAKCLDCGKEFKSLRSLRQHKNNVHLNQRNYVCQICGHTSKIASQLKLHQQTKHSELYPPEVLSKYKCEECDRIFSSPKALKNHIKSQHRNEYPYHCPICGQGLMYKQRLKWHMLAHSDERNSECKLCQAKFKRPAQLNVHMRRHTGELLPCDICGKRFINTGALRRHMGIHNGEFKYSCEICGKKFAIRNYLYIHMRSHETKEERKARLENKKEYPLQKLYYELKKKKENSNLNINPSTETASEAGESGPMPGEDYPLFYNFDDLHQRKRTNEAVAENVTESTE